MNTDRYQPLIPLLFALLGMVIFTMLIYPKAKMFVEKSIRIDVREVAKR